MVIRKMKHVRKPAQLERSGTSQLRLELPSSSLNRRSDESRSKADRPTGVARECQIVTVGKRRDGGTRYWCLEHKADATAKYGRRADHCRYAHQVPLKPEDVLELDTKAFPGGIALWGAVPPAYDTTQHPLDRGIHVHARPAVGSNKSIDATYRGVVLQLCLSARQMEFSVSELDAIYYMATAVFGYGVRYIECTFCNYPHLDKDWFSVHAHRRHLCSGCGRNFRDTETAIGNPIAAIQAAIGHRTRIKPSKKKLNIRQQDFPGGIQIWGSNPAIVWTGTQHEEAGIHIHAFKSDSAQALPDDTYAEVVIDGLKLDSDQVRTMMVQSALPHIAGRVKNVHCTRCGKPHFSIGEGAFTPATVHQCKYCKREFSSVGRLRKIIANPFVGVIEQLSIHAVRRPQTRGLDLLPETL